MKRKGIMLLLIWVAFILQSTVFKLQTFTNVSPNLLLMMTVSIAFMQGKKEGILAGFASGLFLDLFFGSILGIYSLLYMLLGYAVGHFASIYFDEDVTIPVILVTVGDFLLNFIIYIGGFLLRGRVAFPTYLMQIILPEMVFTSIMTLIFYRLIYRINHMLSESEKEERQSIWIRD
ncbi:MAG: rod shape-determining protein MreD [Lachnospiraceae bacterium]|nr:rod shape-determining protein MreD [Lachnospiraceae bacterium]